MQRNKCPLCTLHAFQQRLEKSWLSHPSCFNRRRLILLVNLHLLLLHLLLCCSSSAFNPCRQPLFFHWIGNFCSSKRSYGTLLSQKAVAKRIIHAEHQRQCAFFVMFARVDSTLARVRIPSASVLVLICHLATRTTSSHGLRVPRFPRL